MPRLYALLLLCLAASVAAPTAEPREPSFVVEPLALSYVVDDGEESDPQTVSISNVGNADGTFQVLFGDTELGYSVGSDDRTVEPDSTEELVVTVFANGADVEPGAYVEEMTIETDDPDNPEFIVEITTVVNPVVSNEDGTEEGTFRFETYPNPFTEQATLRYDLPEAATVRVEVYDVAGRRVATLVDEPQAAGTHEVEWDAAGLPSGVYVYQIDAGRFSETQQITLVR